MRTLSELKHPLVSGILAVRKSICFYTKFYIFHLFLTGLSNNIKPETFDYYRAAEIKHGRVCMLAILGYIVPEIYRFSGEIAPGVKFASIPNGVAAIEAVPALGWLQILFAIGFVDFRLSTGKSAYPFAYAEGIPTFSSAEEKTKYEAILELLRHDSQNLVAGGSFDGLSTKLITGLPFLY